MKKLITIILILFSFIGYSQNDSVQYEILTDQNFTSIIQAEQEKYNGLLNQENLPNKNAMEAMVKELFEIYTKYMPDFQTARALTPKEVQFRTKRGDRYVVKIMVEEKGKDIYMITSDTLQTEREAMMYILEEKRQGDTRVERIRNGEKLEF